MFGFETKLFYGYSLQARLESGKIRIPGDKHRSASHGFNAMLQLDMEIVGTDSKPPSNLCQEMNMETRYRMFLATTDKIVDRDDTDNKNSASYT
ncbi:hypothetical protein Y1Q_0015171 [Alligator mississippiensis]|uniref:Uncharacterized protein n=1 Tax=Alligator mississippiensis TaxID=8496 RepID=A0A151P976_ALLMI|nr:hypothetical protein Y1Q_0015171 [Alligator mississippiensis]